jgi:SH3-like domain-containing protein
MSTTEFTNENYGGSLYLATQAKNLAKAGETRLAGTRRAALRPGEVPFAIPLSLRVEATANVREGPGTSFRVMFTLERQARVIGHSYLNEWVRISDPQGRTGWVFYTLVGPGEQSGSN